MCHSLLGQAYYGLCLESDQVARKDTINMAYEYLSNAIKPKYNLKVYFYFYFFYYYKSNLNKYKYLSFFRKLLIGLLIVFLLQILL